MTIKMMVGLSRDVDVFERNLRDRMGKTWLICEEVEGRGYLRWHSGLASVIGPGRSAIYQDREKRQD